MSKDFRGANFISNFIQISSIPVLGCTGFKCGTGCGHKSTGVSVWN